MIEQQYTCPFCHEDYTQYTISEHYGCGVEPLETIEDIEQELDAISEEVAEQESVPVIEEEAKPDEAETGKPEPKKRGRKPKTPA